MKRFTVRHARAALAHLKRKLPRGATLRDLARGMTLELEHRDVTGGDPIASARIALVHLRKHANAYRPGTRRNPSCAPPSSGKRGAAVTAIRCYASDGTYLLTHHARQRMRERSVDPNSVREILLRAAAADTRDRSRWRVHGRDASGRPIDVVVGFDTDPPAVVTVIRPGETDRYSNPAVKKSYWTWDGKRRVNPFAGFKDFADCERYAARRGARDTGAYCGAIKARTEGTRRRRNPSQTHQLSAHAAAVDMMVDHFDGEDGGLYTGYRVVVTAPDGDGWCAVSTWPSYWWADEFGDWAHEPAGRRDDLQIDWPVAYATYNARSGAIYPVKGSDLAAYDLATLRACCAHAVASLSRVYNRSAGR